MLALATTGPELRCAGSGENLGIAAACTTKQVLTPRRSEQARKSALPVVRSARVWSAGADQSMRARAPHLEGTVARGPNIHTEFRDLFCQHRRRVTVQWAWDKRKCLHPQDVGAVRARASAERWTRVLRFGNPKGFRLKAQGCGEELPWVNSRNESLPQRVAPSPSQAVTRRVERWLPCWEARRAGPELKTESLGCEDFQGAKAA